MPAEWIEQPGRREVTLFTRHFTYASDPNSGFMFDVDDAGSVILTSDAARANYDFALREAATGTMIDHGVQAFTSEHWDPGTIRCICGQPLPLSGGDTTRCACRNEYNSCGQLLRANWREFCRETGELSDQGD